MTSDEYTWPVELRTDDGVPPTMGRARFGPFETSVLVRFDFEDQKAAHDFLRLASEEFEERNPWPPRRPGPLSVRRAREAVLDAMDDARGDAEKASLHNLLGALTFTMETGEQPVVTWADVASEAAARAETRVDARADAASLHRVAEAIRWGTFVK